MTDDPLSYLCPTCGAEVRVGGACPGCKAGEGRGKRRQRRVAKSWEQDESADGLDLPDEEFDYDDFVAREFGKVPHRRLGVSPWWWLLGVLALAAMMVGAFFR